MREDGEADVVRQLLKLSDPPTAHPCSHDLIASACARSIGGYKALLADASAGIERLVSRELDFRRVVSR